MVDGVGSGEACPSEDLLQAFVLRDLAGEDLAAMEAHLGDCSRCLAVVANAVPDGGADVADLPAGASVDRYHILATAGEGAMGIVYAAYDPKLDRKVALKVLRHAGGDFEERLLREARAMARLSHPNVVAVHDVGTFDGGLFVAMDFVEGKTLREWLGERQRSWREVVATFAQAGRGLGAAHAAGIVHRDFKPDNVLVRNDGAIVVTDFGLARMGADAGAPAARQLGPPLEITSTGALLGTPAFMSPEQLAGGRVDARSDVFSFCVTLYAALFGQHPFPLSSLRELLSAVEKGQARPPPDSGVPGFVRDAVLLGMRPRPEDRPQTMGVLLRALERDPRRAARFAAAGATVAVLLAAAWVGLARDHAPVCRGAERRLAGVWDPEQRAALRSALAATGSPLAADSTRGAERVFDAYAASWIAAHQEACEATRVRGEQSEIMLDRRMACLDERRQQWAALIRSVTEARAEDVARLVTAAYDLPPVETCADPRRLAAGDSTLGPAFAPLVTLARASVARARALGGLGRFEDGLRALQPALAAAAATGFAPLEAEARLVEGNLHFDADARRSEEALHAAMVAAERAGRLDITAEAEVRLVKNLGYYQLKTAEALSVADIAEAHVQRLDDPLLRADLLSARGACYSKSNQPELALAPQREAVALFEARLGPDHPKVALAMNLVALSLMDMGRYAEALPIVSRGLAIRERALGREHPDTLRSRNNTAINLMELGRLQEALALQREIYDSMVRVLGPDHPAAGGAASNVGNLLVALGRFDEAAPITRQALANCEKTGRDQRLCILANGILAEALGGSGHGDEADAASRRAIQMGERLDAGHPLMRRALTDRGSAMALAGRCGEALPALRRAIAMFEASSDRESADLGYPLHNLGQCELQVGRPAQAAEAYRRALALRERGLPAGHFLIGQTLLGLADVELASGRPDAAAPLARRAHAILLATDNPAVLARSHLQLAQLDWPRDRDAARRHAQDALASLTDIGGHPLRGEVEAWIRTHP